MKNALAYELVPVPTAMFTEDRMQICKAKSTLKSFQVASIGEMMVMQMSLSLIDQPFFGPSTGQLMLTTNLVHLGQVLLIRG